MICPYFDLQNETCNCVHKTPYKVLPDFQKYHCKGNFVVCADFKESQTLEMSAMTIRLARDIRDDMVILEGNLREMAKTENEILKSLQDVPMEVASSVITWEEERAPVVEAKRSLLRRLLGRLANTRSIALTHEV